ncbi:unnamed protein product, partial [Oppiella nova]
MAFQTKRSQYMVIITILVSYLIIGCMGTKSNYKQTHGAPCDEDDACISDNCGIGDFSAITNKDIKLALKGYKGPKNEKFKGYCLHPDRESCIPNEIRCFKDKDCCSNRSSPYLTRNFNHWSKKGVKGPKPIPGFGNILSPFLTEQIILEKDWIKKYGKIYGTFEANKPILTIADPALIKQIMATDSHVFNINVTDPI